MWGLFKKTEKYMGWFGKLPTVGDFVGRGLPPDLKETFHGWMSSGMAAFARSRPQDWQSAYLVSPIWHFLIEGGLWSKSALIGCLAPSVDRVGRRSPLVVVRTVDICKANAALPPESRWLYHADAALRRAIGEKLQINELHDFLMQLAQAEKGKRSSTANILSDLGIGLDEPGEEQEQDWFAWTELAALAMERKGRCFWWTKCPPTSAPSSRQIIHDGVPDENLFCLLMEGGVHE